MSKLFERTILRMAMLMFALAHCGNALADNETMSFLPDGNGGVTAVMSGFLADLCHYSVLPPSSIVRAGSDIQIASPFIVPPPCVIPVVPPRAYTTSAPLGVLPPGTYTVTWTVTNTSFVRVGSFTTQGVLGVSVSTLSTHGLFVLGLLIGLGAWAARTRAS